jgi:hypothetical protein
VSIMSRGIECGSSRSTHKCTVCGNGECDATYTISVVKLPVVKSAPILFGNRSIAHDTLDKAMAPLPYVNRKLASTKWNTIGIRTPRRSGAARTYRIERTTMPSA